MIVPPPGMLSKPSAGGYAFKEVLGQEDVTYRTVQKTLHSICQMHLTTEKLYHEQTAIALANYCIAALKEYPIIANYIDQWPARDFAKMYLKNITAQQNDNYRFSN
ncbi:hypothetical protein BDR06DRAFT_1037540 [Suillus hirtellus]|nr:hypothetical protein BDR06DRAFT_1037540 [Suillus hirtellus]